MRTIVRHPRRIPESERTPKQQPSRGCSPALAALLLVCILLTLGGTPPAAAAPKDSFWGASYFSNAPLVTQDGQVVRIYDDLLKDKLVVIHTFSTRCDACLVEIARMAQVQKCLGDRVGRDLFLYSITVDPARDTPSVLKAYAEKHHAGPGWRFLTGQQADIDLLRTKLGLLAARNVSDPFARTATLVTGNEPTGEWRLHTAVHPPQRFAMMIDSLLPGGNPRQLGKCYAETTPPTVKGQYLFATRCAACHTIGQGDGDGPDLRGVTSRRGRAWLARWLAAPDQMLADGDPTATALFARYNNEMPNLRLGVYDVAALLAYLEVQSAGR